MKNEKGHRTFVLMRIIFAVAFLFLLKPAAFSQKSDSLHEVIVPHGRPVEKKKVWLVAGTHAALWTGSFVALNKAWYANYPKESFHFFNDFREWNQMDKVGHVWTAYQINRISSAMWRWTGLNEKKSTIYGGLAAIAYQSMIEIQDGFSSQWGFSWPDMAANVTGAAAYSAQQLTWKEQRISIKMSYHQPDYPAEAIDRRNELYGKSSMERILKDYNGQTYWASVNIKSFAKQSNWPEWLNIAVGYGADGILGGFDNKVRDDNGTVEYTFYIDRKRQFYISPDIDLTKIKTRSKFMRSVLYILNAVKVPAPTLSWDSKGIFRVHAVYF